MEAGGGDQRGRLMRQRQKLLCGKTSAVGKVSFVWTEELLPKHIVTRTSRLT